MNVLTYEQLITELANSIKANDNKEITGPVLNAQQQNFIDTAKLKHIVLDAVARNAITAKYKGMQVFVTGEDKSYFLKNDLVTWEPMVTDAYSTSEVDSLVGAKESSVPGKGLSTNDFTNPLKAKLESLTVRSIVLNPTTPYTANNGDIIIWDATAGDKVVNLPESSASANFQVDIKKTDSSSNTITVDPFGSEEIEEGTEAVLLTQYEAISAVCDAVEWWITASI